MVQEVLPGIFQLKIPLPNNPLRALNSYLIKGKERSLLIDTGFNWPECKEAQLEGIAALGLDWADIDFFITHVHGDHSGLVYALARPGSRIYCSRTDADLLRFCMTEPYWLTTNAFFILHGFPPEKVKNQGETVTNFISGSDIDFTYVEDGDVIEVGGYRLVCTATPGHSPGHMCLYEPEHKFLVSGDHILSRITSNITAWMGIDDFLGHYLSSLDKVDAMDIKLVLPGHREIIHDCHLRITQLKQHHERRLQEIRNILLEGEMTGYQVASHMHWDLTYKSWDEFPSYQQWFATGEAIAHLEYLAERNELQRIEQGEWLLYKRS